MTMNEHELEKKYSVARTLLLLRNLALAELPIALITAGVVFGLNLTALIITGTVPLNAMGDGASAPLWGAGILLLGLYFASRAFKDMHGRTGTDWLLLPATPAEKWTAGTLWILAVWPVLSALAAMASSGALAGLAVLGGAASGVVWHPFDGDGLTLALTFWSFAPVFLAGSAVFRKVPLVKTLGVMTAAVVLASLVTVPLFLNALKDGAYEGSFRLDNGQY